jgi:hypothetical protein
VDGRASRGSRRAVEITRQSMAEDLGGWARWPRPVTAYAASASSRRGPWALRAPGGRFSPYPKLASWRWALGPFHARQAARWGSAGARRAVFDTPKFFAIPKSDQLVRPVLRHTQI